MRKYLCCCLFKNNQIRNEGAENAEQKETTEVKARNPLMRTKILMAQQDLGSSIRYNSSIYKAKPVLRKRERDEIEHMKENPEALVLD